MCLMLSVANVQYVIVRECLREFIITCVTPPDLLSQKLSMQFRIIGCGKGRNWLRGEGDIKCLLRCPVFTEDRIKIYKFLELSVTTTEWNWKNGFHLIFMWGRWWAVPTMYKLLLDPNYPENTFASNLLELVNRFMLQVFYCKKHFCGLFLDAVW